MTALDLGPGAPQKVQLATGTTAARWSKSNLSVESVEQLEQEAATASEQGLCRCCRICLGRETGNAL